MGKLAWTTCFLTFALLCVAPVAGAAKPDAKPVDGGAAKGRAALEAALARGRLSLVSADADRHLNAASYWESEPGVAWFVDVALTGGRTGRCKWSGEVGFLPVTPDAGREPDSLGSPTWAGDSLVFPLDGAGCADERGSGGELRIRPRSATDFAVTITTCSPRPIPMKLGEGPGARSSRWSRETTERVLASAAKVVSGLTRDGERWRYGQQSLSDCFACTDGCDRSRLGAVCQLGESVFEGSSPDEPCQRYPSQSGPSELVFFLPVDGGGFGVKREGTYGRCDGSWGTWTGCFPAEPPARRAEP